MQERVERLKLKTTQEKFATIWDDATGDQRVWVVGEYVTGADVQVKVVGEDFVEVSSGSQRWRLNAPTCSYLG